MKPLLSQSTATLRRTSHAAALLALTSEIWLAAIPLAHADTGKLLLTGGVSTVEGAAGGGLSPWAVKTNADGVATLPDVPEGAARLQVWHVDQLLDATPTLLTVVPVTAISVETRVQPRRRRP